MSTENTTPPLAEGLDPIAVDARFAGGTIFVHAEALEWDPSTDAVRLALPGLDLPLQCHEALALAKALLRAALPADVELETRRTALPPARDPGEAYKSLALLRREAGMSRRALARAAGIRVRSLRRIERGTLAVSLSDVSFITLSIVEHMKRGPQ